MWGSVTTAMLSIFILIWQIWLLFISDYNNSRRRTENSVASLNAEMIQVLFYHTDKPGHWTAGISMLASKQPLAKPSHAVYALWGVSGKHTTAEMMRGEKKMPTATQMNSSTNLIVSFPLHHLSVLFEPAYSQIFWCAFHPLKIQKKNIFQHLCMHQEIISM